MINKEHSSKVINAWAFYDWANSVYPLVITSTIFPIYYLSVTSSGNSDLVNFLGFKVVNSALYTYAISFSYLIIAIISPILSGIADSKGNKKTFMKLFCYFGAFSCSSMYLFDIDTLWLGIAAMILASIGFSGSMIFYNAYLPEITVPSKYDIVSAQGFMMGYIGSSLLLIFNLSMILYPEIYGITDKSLPAKISFLLTGIWWFGFAQITFYYLPNTTFDKNWNIKVLLNGYAELKKVWINLKQEKNLNKFLLSFFFYNMGVQTVMYVATLFGDKELKLRSSELIISILIIQFVAIGGAYLFSSLSKKIGNIRMLIAAVIIWIGVCVGAYFVYDVLEFYMLATVVGVIMGGIQALSRSTFAKLLPPSKENSSYFSFYEITEKFSIMIGTVSFGLIEHVTGNMRNSIFALILFFIFGLILLIRLRNISINS